MIKNRKISFDNIGDGQFILPEEFIALFPKLSQLLNKAVKIEFTMNGNQRFRQYIWTNDEGKTSGWLCKLEHCIPQNRNYIDEHIFLAKTVGGIVDYWYSGNRDKLQSFIDANRFTFSLTDSSVGIGDLEDKYTDESESGGLNSFDLNRFVTFALEANGNTTFYDHQTKDVFVHLHDDFSPFATNPSHIDFMHTIYKYDKVKTFTAYVEELAQQWLEALNS